MIINNNSGFGGGGVLPNGGTLTLQNTILAGNTTGATPDDITSNGSPTADHDLVQTPGGGLTYGVSGNIVGASPQLGSLANNGGLTQTVLPLPGSPVLGAGNFAVCAAPPINGFDQRGVRRPTSCAIGSAEPGVPPVPALPGWAMVALVGLMAALGLNRLGNRTPAAR